MRIAIVHARWNTAIIEALVSGAVKSLVATGVSKDNIVIQSVPGSYELPVAVQKFVVLPHSHQKDSEFFFVSVTNQINFLKLSARV